MKAALAAREGNLSARERFQSDDLSGPKKREGTMMPSASQMCLEHTKPKNLICVPC
jgi:hypothetical protein